jgi:hypothetical protein
VATLVASTADASATMSTAMEFAAAITGAKRHFKMPTFATPRNP